MFKDYFQNLWFTENEASVFKALYILWTKPASTIAKYLWMERTWVYKILQRLIKENLIYETSKDWVKHFFIPNIDILKNYTKKKINKYKKLDNDFDLIKEELLEFDDKKNNSLPKISIFDSNTWIENIHKDIVKTTLDNWYINIKLFASNTVDSQVSIPSNLKKSSVELFKELKNKKVSIQTFLWNWIMLMENISKTTDIWVIEKLPASNSAINIFIVWKTLYIIIFKESSFWIKIESEDLANTMHFLFNKVEFDG